MSLTFLDSAMIKSPLKVPALSGQTLDITTITFPLSDDAGNKPGTIKDPKAKPPIPKLNLDKNFLLF
jgi:hypothetical protein